MSYDYDALVDKVYDFRRRALDLDEGHGKGEEESSKMELLQGAMETFETLSQRCPMTPLLWIQYGTTAFDFCQELAKANDSSDSLTTSNSLETETQILQLGLEEFPGSLLMRLRQIHVLKKQEQLMSELSQPQGQELMTTLEQAIAHVGRGSYSCETAEAELVVSLLYEPLATIYVTTPGKAAKASNLLLVQQATRPLPSEDLLSFFKKLRRDHNLPQSEETDDVTIETGRRLVAKYYYGALQLPQLETTLQALLHQQRLLPPWELLTQNESDDDYDEFWTFLLKPDPTTMVGMGYGNNELAQSFVQYANELASFRAPAMENDSVSPLQLTQEINDLAVSIYERAVAECPTAELVWTSYLNHMENLARKLSQQNESNKDVTTNEILRTSPSRLQAISRRACRNCPYSLLLAQRRVELQGFLAHSNFIVLEPDNLLDEIVQPALGSKFLPEETASCTLYSTILRVVQQRILTLLVSTEPAIASFDIPLDPSKQHKGQKAQGPKNPIPDDVMTEIQDLAEDWMELCSSIDLALVKERTKHATAARSILAQQRAQSLQHVIQPLMRISSSHENEQRSDVLDDDEAFVVLQKAAKFQNPAHPDTQLNYVREHFLRTSISAPLSSPAEIPIRLCHVRYLFQRAVSLSGSGSSVPVLPFQRDFSTAFHALAFEWTQFERQFGSPESQSRAHKTIQRKLEKFDTASLPTHRSYTNSINATRAEANIVVEASHATKVLSSLPATQSHSAEKPHKPKDGSVPETTKDGNSSEHNPNASAKQQPGEREKAVVKVGNLEYPAHEFTVRVFRLAETVNDMDLVETFQNSQKCGRLVHARILRDKNGKSKGWGLVQFEERESVEKALGLDDNVGIHERTIKVQRSHMAAVPGIVPPGHHRVKPKGEGKATKRNLKRKAERTEPERQVQAKEAGTDSPKSSAKASVLNLVPRGVAKGPSKRLALDPVHKKKA